MGQGTRDKEQGKYGQQATSNRQQAIKGERKMQGTKGIKINKKKKKTYNKIK
jgi:hypothetical protein